MASSSYFPNNDDESLSVPPPSLHVDSDEPLLNGDMRMTTYPLVDMEIWDAYKKQQASFWVAEEIDFSKDREHFGKLSDDEQRFVKNILVFFAASDTLVSINLMNNFCKEVTLLEAQYVYTYQAMMENVHAETYSILIETFIQDTFEKEQIYTDMAGMESVKRKVEWTRRWTVDDAPFCERLVAFAIVEGLFFSGAFCAIYWIKQRNLLPGLTKSNEFIARDEGQHTLFACMLQRRLKKRMHAEDAHAIFREAVEIEKEFICDAVPCRLVGMNATLMCQYIEYVADKLLMDLGYDKLYGSTNPFSFMDLLGMEARSNFFEERPSMYQRADVMNKDEDRNALFSDEF